MVFGAHIFDRFVKFRFQVTWHSLSATNVVRSFHSLWDTSGVWLLQVGIYTLFTNWQALTKAQLHVDQNEFSWRCHFLLGLRSLAFFCPDWAAARFSWSIKGLIDLFTNLFIISLSISATISPQSLASRSLDFESYHLKLYPVAWMNSRKTRAAECLLHLRRYFFSNIHY